jgi:hypothetical protein
LRSNVTLSELLHKSLLAKTQIDETGLLKYSNTGFCIFCVSVPSVASKKLRSNAVLLQLLKPALPG